MQITTCGFIGHYPCILASLLSRFLLSRTQHARLLARSCREGMRGDEEYRDPPRVAHEKATTFALLHPDFGRPRRESCDTPRNAVSKMTSPVENSALHIEIHAGGAFRHGIYSGLQ
jgi:hypothetical protein